MTTRAVTLGGTSYPVTLPSIRDPRLHVASVIITIHILGQVALHFRVSVPQILAAILTCFILEVLITLVRTRTIAWPASAMLTGSGVALILRVVGTRPDDHWSTDGWLVFAAVAGLSLLSKYLIRYRGAPLFNPSNVGLVGAFLLLGPSRVEPLDFWWAPLNGWMLAAYAAILTGGLLVARRLGLLGLAATFWIALAVGSLAAAAAGHCITTNWAFAPVCGGDYWRVVVTSPEVLIFLFFMITDPRTVPTGRVGRVVFGGLVGLVSALFMAPQTDEFGAKVGLLAGLVVVCATRPIIERFVPASRSAEDRVRRYAERRVAGAATAAMTAILLITTALASSGLARTGVTSAGLVDADATLIDPTTFPPITVEGAVSEWDPTLTGTAMREVLLTLAQNLEIEDRALLQADGSLLESVDHGDRLAQMRDRIAGAAVSGTTEIAHYRFDSVDVALLRPFGRQDGLSLGLKARGTVTTETYDAQGRLGRRESSAFSLTFAVRRATGARWLNVAVLAGDH